MSSTSRLTLAGIAVAALAAIIVGLTRSTPAVTQSESVTIVITSDKVDDPDDGWVRYDDGTRHWIDATCRTQLKQAGVPVEVLDWPTINAIPDRPQPNCNEIPTGTPIDTPVDTPTDTVIANPSAEPATPATSPIGSGVNLAGGEYACAQGWGIFEHSFEITDQQLGDQLEALGVNTVRVPVNEHCWLGDDPAFTYIPVTFRGEAYRSRIEALVTELNQRAITAIIDLHWNAATGQATQQQKMADASYSLTFWESVAARFRDNPLVVFDAYNEPHSISWACWRDGCTVDEGGQTAGMQQIVDAIRSTGATQPIILSGLDFAGDLSGWLDHVPNDPADNLMAGFHAYNRIHVGGQTYVKQCGDEACWNNVLLPIAAAGYPVVAAEVGQDVGLETCATDFVNRFYNWADRHGIAYMAWSYNPHGCSSPGLITSYDGTLNNAGRALAARLG